MDITNMFWPLYFAFIASIHSMCMSCLSFLKSLFIINFMCLCISCACLSLHYMCTVSTATRKGHQIAWDGVIACCEPPFGFLRLKPDLEEQPVHFITKSSLQLPCLFTFKQCLSDNMKY